MECEKSIFETLLPAITALAGVLITLIVQGFFERSRRKHESNIGSRIPLTSTCEELIGLLDVQMSALTDIEALLHSGVEASTHPSLRILAEKAYRKKIWVIIEDQACVQPINRYALAVESLAKKILARQLDDKILNEVRNARNELGTAMKNATKHIAEIWGLEVVREN